MLPEREFVGSLGHTSEDNTGLIYMRARYMDPAIGRFIAEDPACSGDNWYAYCGNNPVNLLDADGRASDPVSDVLRRYGNAAFRNSAAYALALVFMWLSKIFLARGLLLVKEGAAMVVQGEVMASLGDSWGPIGAAFAESAGAMVSAGGGRLMGAGMHSNITGWMCRFAALAITVLGSEAFDYWGDIRKQAFQQ